MGEADDAKAEGPKRAAWLLTERKAVFPLVLATVRARWRTVLEENIFEINIYLLLECVYYGMILAGWLFIVPICFCFYCLTG